MSLSGVGTPMEFFGGLDSPPNTRCATCRDRNITTQPASKMINGLAAVITALTPRHSSSRPMTRPRCNAGGMRRSASNGWTPSGVSRLQGTRDREQTTRYHHPDPGNLRPERQRSLPTNRKAGSRIPNQSTKRRTMAEKNQSVNARRDYCQQAPYRDDSAHHRRWLRRGVDRRMSRSPWIFGDGGPCVIGQTAATIATFWVGVRPASG